MDMIEKQIDRRRKRGETDIRRIQNRGRHPVYSAFEVTSNSGRTYEVRIRDLEERRNTCTCPDYRTNLVGTCKHIESVLSQLEAKHGRSLAKLAADRPQVTQIYVHYERDVTVRVDRPAQLQPGLEALLRRYFDADGVLSGKLTRALPALLRELEGLPEAERGIVEVDEHVKGHLELLAGRESVAAQQEWFEAEVRAGNRSMDLLSAPLYPYQADGAMHLAFGRRAMLADDMGLGKTVQAIAAIALLKQLRDIERVLIVCPASLKHQWAREVRRFTTFEAQVVGGPPAERKAQYARPAFFNMINYELVLRDGALIRRLQPDVVILDEAQRIKNWRTKTAQAVKRLQSPYAFVLTGTPLENRLDELYSLFQFLDPRILGPLWHFNERYYELEQKGPSRYHVLGYKNMAELRRRIGPYVLRRTRDEVLADLPGRTDNNFFVEMTDPQWRAYDEYQATAARILSMARRRPLTPKEQKILLGAMVKMRLICNALALHDHSLDESQRERTSPKLRELRNILDDEVSSNGHKALIFSQWTGMLELVAPILKRLGLGYELLSGDVPTDRRGRLIERFFEDDDCRVFLSTDAGGTGLNLQAASLVINLDLPWNPAVLEQRIARAHRHGQPHAVQVVNLIARETIEERMLDTLAAKRGVFEGVFGDADAPGDIRFADTGQSLLQTLDDLLGRQAPPAEVALEPASPAHPAAPADAAPPSASILDAKAPAPTLQGFADRLVARFPGRVLLVRSAPAPKGPPADTGTGVLVVVDNDPAALRSQIEAQAADHWPQARPALFLMEREGYRTLTLLTGDASPPAAADEPYRAPALPAADPTAALRRRIRQAEAGLTTAARRLRLAEVMLEGGFPEDVTGPIREALGWTLSSLMLIVDDGPAAAGRAPSAVSPSPRAVQAALVETGHLPPDLAARLSHARELTAPPDADDEATPLSGASAEVLVTTARDLVELARERVMGRAVGWSGGSAGAGQASFRPVRSESA